jgi:FixJ family two-component response regulator
MTCSGPTVFVVDDDLSVRRAVARLLTSAGFAVETYPSGRAFLDAVVAQPRRGCVVLDVRMPGMSGFDVMQCLAARGLDFPVVLVTGDGDASTAVRAMHAKCSCFLAKPFEDEMLIDAVRRALLEQEGDRSGHRDEPVSGP